MNLPHHKLVKAAFRSLPIPGKYLSSALAATQVDCNRIPIPSVVFDRWGGSRFEISDPSDIIQRHIYFQGYFEFWESKYVRRTLGAGEVFVDIGANIGWYSLLASSRVKSTGRVIAFEPVSSTFAQLKRNADLNRFSQLELHPYGLGVANEELAIYALDPGNAGANTLHASPGGAELERVEIRRGDESLAALGVKHIDFCKIDVEGAEMDVVRGLSDLLEARAIRRIMIEMNRDALARAGHSAAELIESLRSFGFHLSDMLTHKPVRSESELGRGLNVICEL